MRRLLSAAVVGLLLPAVAQGATVGPDSPGCTPRTAPPIPGQLTVAATKALDSRIANLTVHSPAMGQDEHVNVMLPAGYDPSGATRYPVLYLLHGALGGYMDWVTQGNVEKLIGGLPLIVVMPDDGYDGSYADWYGLLSGQAGPVPAWETYHTRELIPFIDSHYPTLADRGHRFVAGLSSGGGGAVHYATDNPGMFGAVGSFSGAVDILDRYPFYPTLSEGLWLTTDAPGDGPDGHCTWGDPYTQKVVWESNDPTYLAANLKQTPLWLASGNGFPGPLDPAPDPSNPSETISREAGQTVAGLTEAEVWQMNQNLVKALDAAGIPHTDFFYGNGTHSWPYWQRDLTKFLVWLAPYIGHPVAAPRSFSFRTARTAFSAWGWSFAVSHRDVREFVYLSRVGSGGFDALGSGSLAVTTPAQYRPGGDYAVDVNATRLVIQADSSGSLNFGVDLGPSHEVQQYRFGRLATLGWQRTTVRIEPL